MEPLLEYLVEWIEVIFMFSISSYLGYDIYKKISKKESVSRAYVVCFALSFVLSMAAAITLVLTQ